MHPRVPRPPGRSGGPLDDTTVDANFEHDNEVRAQLHRIGQNRISEDLQKLYRNWIDKYVVWLKHKHPGHAGHGGLVDRSVAADGSVLEVPMEMCMRGSTVDVNYAGLNAKFPQAFILANAWHTVRGGRRHKKFDALRKIESAFKWGSRRAGEQLPTKYCDEMQDFLKSLAKHCAKLDDNGKTVEGTAADPIPFPLMKKLCLWSLEENRVRDWAWTIWQWNLMCRSNNMDPLRLRFFARGTDSVRVIFRKTKADQKGKRVTWKNVYANSETPEACAFLSMGCYLCVHGAYFDCGEDLVFRHTDGKKGASSST